MSEDWEDAVVKLPPIPAEGPMPDVAAEPIAAAPRQAPKLPAPPAVRAPGSKPTPAQLAAPKDASAKDASAKDESAAADEAADTAPVVVPKSPASPTGGSSASASANSASGSAASATSGSAVKQAPERAADTKSAPATAAKKAPSRSIPSPDEIPDSPGLGLDGVVAAASSATAGMRSATSAADLGSGIYADAGRGAAIAVEGVTAVSQAADIAAIEVSPARPRRRRSGPKRAHLRVARIDPWSVMKVMFLFSIAFGIMSFIAIYAAWGVIEGAGLFDAVNEFVRGIITNTTDTAPWDIHSYISLNKVLGITALVSVINVVLITALGTLVAFLYNLSSTAIGGFEVTLTEE